MKREKKLLLAAGLCALLGVLLGVTVTGMRFSAYLLVAAAAVLAALAWLDALGGTHRAARLARRALLLCLAVGLFAFAALEAWIISQARTDEETETGCVIVLGAGVNGTEPSMAMRLRLEAALKYLQSHPGLPVIVSGSQGAGEEISEAEAMARWLLAHGVSETQIHREEQARNTEENLRYSREIMTALGMAESEPVAVVSNDFHLCRAKLLARRQGMDAVGVACRFPGVLPYSLLQVNYYAREAFAMVKAILF